MWDQLVTFIHEQLQTNDLFKGGALLMAGGSMLALARPLPGYLWNFIKRQSMVVLDIPDKDPAFKWVNEWLARHSYSKNRARLLTIKTTCNDATEHGRPKIIFSPAPGIHYLWYKNRLIILSRNRQGGQSSSSSAQDPFREYFTLRILGRGRDIALKLIEEAYQAFHPTKFGKLTVHRAERFGRWEAVSWVPERDFDSVILPDGAREQMVSHIHTFLTSEDWYVKMGIPFRTGCLIYGSPGNGKTSSIIALASHFGFDMSLLNLKSADISDEDLAHALSDIPNKSFIVLEDIDCVIKGREVKGAISFSGLLNALDGMGSAHGQIIFMTTNHFDALDPALIRPGRCDLLMEFPNANLNQKTRLFERFFPGAEKATEFAEKVPPGVNMATLQQHMMKYRDNVTEAFDKGTAIKKDVQ